MHSLISSILPALLFFILSPGILTRIPKNGSKYLVTIVHSIIFSILLNFLLHNLPIREGISYDETSIVIWVCVIVGVILSFFVFSSFPSYKQDIY